MEPGFNLTCDRSFRPPKLFLGDGTVPVIEISVPNATVRINGSFAYFPGSDHNYMGNKSITARTWSGALVEGGPYTLADGRNKLVAYGCDVQVLLEGDPNRTLSTSAVLCNWEWDVDGRWSLDRVPADCSGVACCQANIMAERSSYVFKTVQMNGATGPNSAALAWIVESEYNFFEKLLVEKEKMEKEKKQMEIPDLPAVLDWRISQTTCHGNASSAACRSDHSFCNNITQPFGTVQVQNGHLCHCDPGYQGNPYVPNGCYDVNECDHPKTYPCYGACNNTGGGYQCKCLPGYEGNASVPNGCTVLKIGLGVAGGLSFLFLALGTPFITRKIKMHKAKQMKERFFKQNHGLLLQQLVPQKSDIGERMIITLQELQKASNNFDVSHEVGGGGHGVVYKGLLNLQVVAIKKSKIIVQREIDDFINEVAILSQINHRNVVKLLGCCLETEVPLLVYEYISNGTLSCHLHVEGPISLSWDDRVRIASEISRALAYLHSAASTPILHRDIKSSNILLDDNLIAKVSDFGASKYIPLDKTGVTTAVQGTIGYLDPMYYYTGRLTDKSDVFSFGVLVVELLTRKKPFVYRSDDGEGLVSHFTSLLTEGRLVDILDPQIMVEKGDQDQVNEVAALAAKCTKLNSEDRPRMREVEMTLETLRAKNRHAHNLISRMKYDNDQTAAHYVAYGLGVETSRQYTMEEEMLLSARGMASEFVTGVY
ncbi:hypothetical protein EJB05_48437, partial [Eragrostis curvula]